MMYAPRMLLMKGLCMWFIIHAGMCIWFTIHVLQLLPIRFTQQNLYRISKSTIQKTYAKNRIEN